MAKKDEKALMLNVEAGGSLVQARKLFNAAFMELASPFSGKMKVKPVVLSDAYQQLLEVQSVVVDTVTIAKNKMKELVEAKGEVTTEKGSMALVVGDTEYAMRPTRTGPDPKKLEALLRAKEVENLQEYMDATITYKVSESKLRHALSEGVLTEEELAAVEYDKSFALQPPKKVEG